MGTKISYVDETWNTIVGCSKISAGCLNCYAEKMAARQAAMAFGSLRFLTKGTMTDAQRAYTKGAKLNKHRDGKRVVLGGWNGKTVFVESALTKPLHWRTRRKIFVNSMGDTFHESVPFEWVDRIMAVAAVCPQHTFLFLTKRAERMREYMGDIKTPIRIAGEASVGARTTIDLGRFWGAAGWPLLNVHLGVTVENQDNVGRIADLIHTPAAKRFLSIEPLLPGILDLASVGKPGQGDVEASVLDRHGFYCGIDYIFIGCESGPGARLCTLDDIRYVMNQCREAGVKVHVKQIPLNGRCNKHIEQWPKEFQIREA